MAVVTYNKNKPMFLHRCNSSHDHTKEIMRALEFYVQQIKRGWEIGDALSQVESAYGFLIYREVCKALQRWIDRNK